MSTIVTLPTYFVTIGSTIITEEGQLTVSGKIQSGERTVFDTVQGTPVYMTTGDNVQIVR